jgi:hypothetical protein
VRSTPDPGDTVHSSQSASNARSWKTRALSAFVRNYPESDLDCRVVGQDVVFAYWRYYIDSRSVGSLRGSAMLIITLTTMLLFDDICKCLSMPGKQNNIKQQVANLLSGNQQGKRKGLQLKLITIVRELKPHLTGLFRINWTHWIIFRAPQPKVTSVLFPKPVYPAAADVYLLIFQLLLMRHRRRHRHRHQVQQTPVYTRRFTFQPRREFEIRLGPTIFWISWCLWSWFRSTILHDA